MPLITSVVLGVLVTALVSDTILGMIMDILYQSNNTWISSQPGLLIYAFIFAVYAVGLSIILKLVHVEQRRGNFKAAKELRQVNRIINYMLLAVLSIVTAQLFSSKSYYTFFLILIASLTYGLSIINFGVLSYMFINWFRIDKNKIILVFCSVVIVMCFNSINSIIFFDSALILNTEPIITHESAPEYRLFLPFDQNQIIATSQSISVAIYVSLTWIGIVMILKYNIKKIGKAMFFLLVIPPFLAVLNLHISSFSTIYPDNPAILVLNPGEYTPFILYIISFLMCAFLFGLGYISVSRHIIQNSLRKFTFITGLGFLLFYISGFSTIINHSFPPFGLLSLSLVGISSYLILVGLHYTAISVSQDLRLKKSLRDNVLRDVDFFTKLGKAESIQGYQDRIMDIIHTSTNSIKEDTSIELSMDIEDAKKYVEEILVNIRKRQV